jgi:acetaldehyde dehydrogenase (acetylating)
MSIHSKNEDVILQFGLKKPAFRICVNTPTTHGSIGLTTGLDPAMTLGCGGPGGNITSDNISPRHLLNIKRLAYEIRPAIPSSAVTSSTKGATKPSPIALPQTASRMVSKGISAQALASKIDTFLASRGYRAPENSTPPPPPSGQSTASEESSTRADNPPDFICEDDVRAAMRSGKKIVVGERTIVTPSARDLGESEHVFVQAGWPR